MTVTKADRDALADMVKARLTHQHGVQGWIDNIATGIRDNTLTSDSNVELQVIAKHREDAERPLLERIEKLEEENAHLREALGYILSDEAVALPRPYREYARQALGEK